MSTLRRRGKTSKRASVTPYELLGNPYVYGPRVLEVDERRKYIACPTEIAAWVKN
jgi:hypothetical protein